MRTIKCLSVLILMMVVDMAGVYAYDFEKDGIFYNILSEEDRTVEVTYIYDSGDSYSGDIVIPQRVINDGKTFAVTTIGDWAFYVCDDLVSVDMQWVTTIGVNAFTGCDALTSVSMPSATTIREEAFSYCHALTSVTMPLVTTIGNYAFDECVALTSITIPASCTSIIGNPFVYCTDLKKIVVDENNPNYSAADGALYDKDKTTIICLPAAEGDITILPSVTMIGDGAFESCHALTSVTMPLVTTIGDKSFWNCFSMASVCMPAVTTIGNDAFSGCCSLASVNIPASVINIGSNAFYDCGTLSSVYCHWKEPLECDPGFGDDVLMNATLYIPNGTMGAYRKVDPWRNFWNIKKME